MGNSQLPTGIPETVDFMEQRIQTIFGSEEEMKRYYLQMCNMMRSPRRYETQESEYVGLKRLSSRLKQYAAFIQSLGEHEWEKGVADIQKALGVYMMQNDIDGKVRRQSNDEIACQLQFIVFLTKNLNLIKQLQGILSHDLSNLTYLLKSMSVAEEQE